MIKANGIMNGGKDIIGEVSKILIDSSSTISYLPIDVFNIIYDEWQKVSDCSYKY